MSLYTLEELLVIGADMRERENFPPEMKDFYSDDNIINRFKSFGGIFRHVLPARDTVKANLKERDCDIARIDCLSLPHIWDIQSDCIGHLTFAYQVERSGESAFQSPSLDFVSEEARSLVEERTMSMGRYDKEFLLLRADQYPDNFLLGLNSKVFVELVSNIISDGDTKNWKYRKNNNNNNNNNNDNDNFKGGSKEFINLNFGRMKISDSPSVVESFSSMKPNTLYHFTSTSRVRVTSTSSSQQQVERFSSSSVLPPSSSSPFAPSPSFSHLYFKRNDSELVCIQLSFGTSDSSLTCNLSSESFSSFCEQLNLSPSSSSSSSFSTTSSSTSPSKILFLFCPNPDVSHLSHILVNGEEPPPETWNGFNFEWGVIHLPPLTTIFQYTTKL